MFRSNYSVCSVTLFLLLGLLSGCGRQPLPEDRMVFAGRWEKEAEYIEISPDGTIDYARIIDGVPTSVSGATVRFDGERLIAEFPGQGKEWRIDSPPTRQDGVWTMKLNGEQFTRANR